MKYRYLWREACLGHGVWDMEYGTWNKGYGDRELVVWYFLILICGMWGMNMLAAFSSSCYAACPFPPHASKTKPHLS